jgi:TatD DNase family protein
MDTKFFDIHCHVNDKAFNDDREATLLRMEEAGVAGIVIGTDFEMSAEAVRLANTKPYLWAAVGQHPVDRLDEVFDPAVYRTFALDPRVVAIGECGLDYYWPSKEGWLLREDRQNQRIASLSAAGASGQDNLSSPLQHSSPTSSTASDSVGLETRMSLEKTRQRELFEAQIALAVEMDKPLMLHGRPSPQSMDAYQDMLTVLRKAYETHGTTVRGNVHFFVGDRTIAESFFALGFTISFTGVITFTHDYDEVIKNAPLDRIMAETDAPYVSPAPYRGKRNEPIHVREVVKRIAEIRGEDEEIVRQALMANAERSFGLQS